MPLVPVGKAAMPIEKSTGAFVLTLPIKWSIAVAIVILVLTAVFYFVSGAWDKTIIFAAAATAAGGTVLVAAYTGRTLNLFLRQEERLRERENALDSLGRQNRAMHFAERWNDAQMYHVRNVFRKLMEKRGLPEAELIEEISKDKTNVIHILNFLEEAAFAREYSLVDEELIRNQFEGILVTLWSTLEPWIKRHRLDRGRPNIWCMVEALYIEWK